MREFAQKQNKPHKANLTNLTRNWKVTPAQEQDTVNGLSVAAGTAFVHDFSRIPIHAKTPVTIQPKLTIGTPGNIHEQEADRVAQQVMRMREPHLRRTCACGGGCPNCQTEQDSHRQLQTQRVQVNDSGRAAVPPIVHEALDSSDQPIDPTTRGFMESRFGHDFSRVRVHTDKASAESASAIGALAYTVGDHIVFGQGQYDPTTKPGQRLLAHELTHVLQQTTGSYMVVQRQVDKGQKGRLKKDSSFMVKEGKIEQKRLSFEYEWDYTNNAGLVTVDIELAYTRESGSKYADPSKLNWFQTLQTNYMTDSREIPPKETEIKEYVDGCGSTGHQDVCFTEPQNTSVFEDILHRRSLPDRNVLFKAETSAVGISDNGLEILGTVEWGFEMDRKGSPKYISLRQVATPSSYHLRKFQELRVREE